jgi:hypothetical protein
MGFVFLVGSCRRHPAGVRWAGKIEKNPKVESFDGKRRQAGLNQNGFESIEEARPRIEQGRGAQGVSTTPCSGRWAARGTGRIMAADSSAREPGFTPSESS